MGLTQRVLWEAGMQLRHGVLGRLCVHVPPGLHKSRLLFIHTLIELSCLQDNERLHITVCLLTTVVSIVLLKNV